MNKKVARIIRWNLTEFAVLFVVIMTKRQHMARLVPSVSIGDGYQQKIARR